MKFPFARRPEREGDPNDRYMDDGFYRGDEDENEGVVDDGLYDDLKPSENAPAPARKAAGGGAGGNMLKVIKPHESADGRDIADYLMQGYTVVMNIEELERSATLRMVDFLLGALYVLGGELRRVTKTTLVLSPRSGEMSGEDDEDENY